MPVADATNWVTLVWANNSNNLVISSQGLDFFNNSWRHVLAHKPTIEENKNLTIEQIR